MLRGIFFLGATLLRDYTINSRVLPPNLQIMNYYSEYLDRVVSLVYSIEGIKAGGEVGFDDIIHFKNFNTTFSHSHKGYFIHRDYSILAEVIGYMMLFKEGIFIDEKPDFEIENKKVMSENLASWFKIFTSWDDVFELRRTNKKLRIQQGWPIHNYRIVIEDKDGQLYQLAKGKSLHAMLRALGL